MAETDPAPAPDPAAGRFWTIQLVRLVGLGLVIFGAMIVAGRVDQNPLVGSALMVIGLMDFLIVPRLLARRWKSRP